jgi:hypothetical protein
MLEPGYTKGETALAGKMPAPERGPKMVAPASALRRRQDVNRTNSRH